MIVEPGFFTHPKTILLTKLLGGDPLAPLYVLKLWAFCQDRRSDSHKLSSQLLAILCGYSGSNANKLESSLIASDFIRRDVDQVTVLGWADHNAKLLAAWSNGSRGGRPKKSETEGESEISEKKSRNETSRKERAKKPQKSAEILEEKTQPKPNSEENEKEESGFPKSREEHMSNESFDGGVGRDPPDDEDLSPVEMVFRHYQRYYPRRFRRIHSDLKEWKLIKARLEKDGFTVMDLCDAIDGCRVSPHHQGVNDTGTCYDSLELIVRDVKHVQQFIEHYESQGRPVLSAKTQRTMFAAEQFADAWTKEEEVAGGVDQRRKA